ncbi:MAG: hypothetical protein QOG91_527 [Candidatus Parcubacteria bacterium]|jgi:hypothetical protein|nr:hypothetical protein [Candidatus Parcubacteria bacterium]
MAACAVAAVAVAQNYQFSRDLSVGATGADVVNLQEWLLGQGYDIPSVRSAAAPKGYFGLQTRAAVAAYQRAAGLPAYGFFGPLTRTRVNGGDSRGASLQVISPNGGEKLQKGSIQTIVWTGAEGLLSHSGSISLLFYTPPCAEPSASIRCMIAVREPALIAEHVSLSSRSYSWLVGTIVENGAVSGANVFDGQYKIQICPEASSVCDTSDAYFIISSNTEPVNPSAPVISGLDSPTRLTVNKNGNWTVHATDPQNGTLFYAVDWGDSSVGVPLGYSGMTSAPQFVQTTTFNHTYQNVGTYDIAFTVKNGAGQITQTKTSVQVVPAISDATPLAVISPNGGEFWQRGTQNIIRWSSPAYFRQTLADISLFSLPVLEPCPAGYSCKPLAPVVYTIVKNIDINQNAFVWKVGDIIDSSVMSAQTPVNINVDNGQYGVRICESGTNNCDDSDGPFNIVAAFIRACPSEKIIDEMPTVGTSSLSSAYYLFNGERHEIGEFDSRYVFDACRVPERTVH